MMRSGLNVPTPAIPMPDFAVPNAAPMPSMCQYSLAATVEFQSAAEDIVHPKIMANAMPAWFPVSYLSGGSEATA